MKNLFRSFAVLIATFCAVSLQAKSPIQATHAESAQSSADSKAEPQKPGQALAHESKEAATGKEEAKDEQGGDEEAKLKESASVRWIADKTGMSPHTAYLVFVWFNFLVIGAVMGKYLIQYLPGMFRNRTASIKQSMEDARKASDDANRRLAEIENKLSRLDVDIAAIRSEADTLLSSAEAGMYRAKDEGGNTLVFYGAGVD